MTNSEHLQWIHDRITKFYGESENTDYLIRLRKIIAEQQQLEVSSKRNLDLSNDSSIMNTFGRDNYGE